MSKQSLINSNPDGSINMEAYNNLDQERWVKMPEGRFDVIPNGYQVRYIKIDDTGKLIFRAGGFMTKELDEYIVVRGYNGTNFSVQKATVHELWYRSIEKRRKKKEAVTVDGEAKAPAKAKRPYIRRAPVKG